MAEATFWEQDWTPSEIRWFGDLARESGFDVRARKEDYGSRIGFSYNTPGDRSERQGLCWHMDHDNIQLSEDDPLGYPPAASVAVVMRSLWENLPRRPGIELLTGREYSLAHELAKRSEIDG